MTVFSAAGESGGIRYTTVLILNSSKEIEAVIFNFVKLANLLCRFQEIAKSLRQKTRGGLYAQFGDGTIL